MNDLLFNDLQCCSIIINIDECRATMILHPARHFGISEMIYDSSGTDIRLLGDVFFYNVNVAPVIFVYSRNIEKTFSNVWDFFRICSRLLTMTSATCSHRRNVSTDVSVL